MSLPAPPPDTHPDAALLALERELEEALMLCDTLARAWDEATTDQGRRVIERQANVTLERIAGLQEEIATTPARTLAGAEVQLRRLAVHVDEKNAAAVALLASVTAAVEGAVGVVTM